MSLIGFDKIDRHLLDSYHNSHLHHGILLVGKKGIGKSSFALEFAQNISNNNSENNPDILLVKKDEGKKEITVDKVRKIFNFVTQTSAYSPNKFVIIDSVCNLNKSASNALLKILEEPRPNNYLILIAHNLSKVLPTIRSRCFIVKASGVTEDEFKNIVGEKVFSLSEEDINFLGAICDNSPALAIELGGDLKRFYELFLRSILNEKISDNLSKIVLDKKFNFEILIRCYEFFILRLFKSYFNIIFNKFYEEDTAFDKLKQKNDLIALQANNDENLKHLYKTIPLNLSVKLTFINIFHSLI
ncbi:MAG: AAA family ATPase [Rickettsiales bacterium]|nr:AAA family ATPase [Rickettsiales bacterium]